MENDRPGEPRQVRLPGFEEPAVARRPAYTWHSDYNGPPGYWVPAGRPRDEGIRSARRASSWTAAALIAGAAAATGYLAHSIPTTKASTAGKAGPARHHTRSRTPAYAPAAPPPAAPVVTSGGSGAAAGGAGGGD